MKNIPEEFWWAIGISATILAIGASTIGLTYAANTYGNQIAKRCIAQHGDWRLVDNRYSQYECHLKAK